MGGGGFIDAGGRESSLHHFQAMENGVEREPRRPPLALWKLVIITSVFIPIQSLWALEFCVVVPYLRSLGLSSSTASLTWIFGPITGLLVQPIVGTFSDSCTSKYGRRRPYIIGFSVLLGVCSVLFASTKFLFSSEGARVAFGTIMFFLMDCMINGVQGPYRAFASDLSAKDQQSLAMALCTLFMGIGGIVGSLLASVFEPLLENMVEVFVVSLVPLYLFLAAACYVGYEKPLDKAAVGERQKWYVPLKNLVAGVLKMPNYIARICIALSVLWLGWFCYFPYVTELFASYVYGGCPEDDPSVCAPEKYKAYNEGITYGSHTSMVYYGLLIVASFLLEQGTKRFSYSLLFSLSIAITAASLLLAGIVTVPMGRDGATVTLILMALPGIGFAATMIFPFAVVGIINAARKDEESNNTGMQMAILNCFICLPQIVSTIVNAAIISAMDIRFIIILGGVYFALGAAVVWIIKVPAQPEEEERERVGSVEDLGKVSKTV